MKIRVFFHFISNIFVFRILQIRYFFKNFTGQTFKNDLCVSSPFIRGDDPSTERALISWKYSFYRVYEYRSGFNEPDEHSTRVCYIYMRCSESTDIKVWSIERLKTILYIRRFFFYAVKVENCKSTCAVYGVSGGYCSGISHVCTRARY